MAFAEGSPEASEVCLDHLADDVGEEVEVFAKFLDECVLARGSAPEQRARIFKLVDHYYGYARDTADALRERQRLDRLARGGSRDSTSSSIAEGPTRPVRRAGLRSGTMETASSASSALVPAAGDDDELEREEAERTAASAQRWEEEAQTWDLLRRLLPLRYRDAPGSTSGPKSGRSTGTSTGPGAPPQSRREYWADFLNEPKALERKTIVEWLQASASSSGASIDELVADLQRNSERGEIMTHGWLHTRGAIKQHKRLVATSEVLDPASDGVTGSNLDAPVRLVTQLDPDVVARQSGRRLAPEDVFFEQAIWRGCYELLRRGKSMAEMRDWCAERTEVWRAASVSALPMAAGSADDDDVPDFDAVSTVLWRRLCYRLSQAPASDSAGGVYERAVYGILSGDLLSVEAVGRSWDDAVFARYNADLRAQFDAYLIRQSDPAAVHAVQVQHGDVPTGSHAHTDYVSRKLGSLDVRKDRDASKTTTTATTATTATPATPAKALQAAVIDEKLDQYLYQQGVLLAAYANKDGASKLVPQYDGAVGVKGDTRTKFVAATDVHGLRVLAHVLIVVAALDKLDGRGKDAAALGPLARRHQTEEHAVASYISFLRLAQLEELVPLYASRLLGERAYANMALNLVHVEDHETQVRLLQLMRKVGLDAVKFVQTLPHLFLADVEEEEDGDFVLDALADGPPSLKFGRQIKTGLFGSGPVSDTNDTNGTSDDDVIVVDKRDELLIRAMEWMMLVDGLALELCDIGVRVHSYFLRTGRLSAARVLVARVACADIVRHKTALGADLADDPDPAWWDDIFGASARVADPDAMLDADPDAMLDADDDDAVSRTLVAAHARPLYELECMVNALDCLETTGVLAQAVANIHTVYVHPLPSVTCALLTISDPAQNRQVAKSIDDNAKLMRGYMKPLLAGWLLHTVDDDPARARLRTLYLPQVVIGFASTLHFAGTTSSRDYMLECMELAALVAAPDSDVAGVLVATGRMKELVESFASCSKALAIWTSDMKKGPGAGSKKTRELGWSRELWSVKQ